MTTGSKGLLGILYVAVVACIVATASPVRIVAAQGVGRSGADAPEARSIEPRADVAAGFAYEEFIVGGGDEGDPLPTIVGLHPWGSGPRGFGRWLREGLDCPARIILPRGPLRYGSGYSWLDALAADSEDALAREIRPMAARLSSFLAAVAPGSIAGEHRTRLPIVTGFSQGGIMALAVAVLHPERIGAAFPVAGLLPRPLWPSAPGRPLPPILALHGTDDSVVSFPRARAAMTHLRGLGWDARVSPVGGVGHAFTPAMKRRLRRELAAALRAWGSCPPHG